MDLFAYNWIGFVITGLGTLFLIGELFVNMRGLFAILGLGFMTLYFSAYMDFSTSFMLMIITYFIGLLLIIIDGKVINDGTLAAIGVAVMLAVVAFAAPNFMAGLYSACGVLLGGGASLIFLKVFKRNRRNLWSKMTLTDRLTAEKGYSTINKEYLTLINEEGITLNDLRPVGTVKIKEKEYSAVSNGEWISKGTRVKVVQVDGTKILVKKLESQK